MKVDWYTRFVLTVIAACLLWLCALGSGRPVEAQQRTPPLSAERPQPVVVVGWGTLDLDGKVNLTMNGGRTATDPQLPVRVVAYPMPSGPVDVRLEYSEGHPLPVGLSSIKPAGPWEPIRSAVEPEPMRPRPGR